MHLNNWGSGRKRKAEKLGKMGKILPLYNGKLKYFHMPEKNEKANFNSSQKDQDFWLLDGT